MPPFRSASRAARKRRKQTVVLVHGMGEPTPMETLRGFVQTVWVDDPDLVDRSNTGQDKPNSVWWKPDFRTGSIELSRITTREAGEAGVRTDFYEFYWADLTAANSLLQLKDWFMSLLLRSPRQVPPEVVWVWLLLWGLTLLFGGVAAWSAVAGAFPEKTIPRWATVVLAISTISAYFGLVTFLLAYFGDVARYVRAKPPNIAARRDIRNRGLDLLRTLRDCGKYDRIVLVGHSLGSIIAYDLLRSLWAENEEMRRMQKGDALHRAFTRLEAAANKLSENPPNEALKSYRDLQGEVFDAIRDGREKQWLISDFVTVGSPLAHAQFLMAHDEAALRIAQDERRYPTSPPWNERERFVYETSPRMGTFYAHHATPFAAVRWTNIYDRAGEIGFLCGDVISGSVTRNFGPGIREFAVKITRKSPWPFDRIFTHTAYWSDTGDDDSHLTPLRKALDLPRRRGNPAYPEEW